MSQRTPTKEELLAAIESVLTAPLHGPCSAGRCGCEEARRLVAAAARHTAEGMGQETVAVRAALKNADGTPTSPIVTYTAEVADALGLAKDKRIWTEALVPWREFRVEE